jgi:hypothetical protein
VWDRQKRSPVDCHAAQTGNQRGFGCIAAREAGASTRSKYRTQLMGGGCENNLQRTINEQNVERRTLLNYQQRSTLVIEM